MWRREVPAIGAATALWASVSSLFNHLLFDLELENWRSSVSTQQSKSIRKMSKLAGSWVELVLTQKSFGHHLPLCPSISKVVKMGQSPTCRPITLAKWFISKRLRSVSYFIFTDEAFDVSLSGLLFAFVPSLPLVSTSCRKSQTLSTFSNEVTRKLYIRTLQKFISVQTLDLLLLAFFLTKPLLAPLAGQGSSLLLYNNTQSLISRSLKSTYGSIIPSKNRINLSQRYSTLLEVSFTVFDFARSSQRSDLSLTLSSLV